MELKHIQLDAWTKHMQEVHKVNACDECQDSKTIGSMVKCRQFPGMEDNIACYKFIGNKQYFERMKVN